MTSTCGGSLLLGRASHSVKGVQIQKQGHTAFALQ